MAYVLPLYSKAGLPAGQGSLYTLKRPTSATSSSAASRSSVSTSGLGRSGNRLLDSLYASRQNGSASPKRPTSALHQSFVAWSRLADAESAYPATCSSYPPRPFSADIYRPGTRPLDSLPLRPGVQHGKNSRWSFEAAVALKECEEAAADPDASNTIDVIERVPLTPIPEERSNEPSVLEHHTFTTPLKAPSASAPISDNSMSLPTAVELSPLPPPSSKKVNDLRDATRAARDDEPRCPLEHPALPSSGRTHVNEPLLRRNVVATEAEAIERSAVDDTVSNDPGAVVAQHCPPMDIFNMRVQTAFVDFVQRDKYFEHLLEYLSDHEHRERLEIALDQTARRNSLYVAMTRPYIRWAETGLNPGEPDPPEPVDPELLALNNLYFRRNRDNIISNEERQRASLSAALLGALSANYQCVYLALEEEAVRRHLQTVYEPERWAFLIGYISNFLSTTLVTGFHIFKEWSLAEGEIERMEAWERVLAEQRFFASMSTLKEEKLVIVETRHRDLIETDERLRFEAILYANAARREAILERAGVQTQAPTIDEAAGSCCESGRVLASSGDDVPAARDVDMGA